MFWTQRCAFTYVWRMIYTRRKRRRLSCCRQQAALTGRPLVATFICASSWNSGEQAEHSLPPHLPHPSPPCWLYVWYQSWSPQTVDNKPPISHPIISLQQPASAIPLRFSLAVPFPHVQVLVEASLAYEQRAEYFYVTFKWSSLRQRPMDDDSSLSCSRSGTGCKRSQWKGDAEEGLTHAERIFLKIKTRPDEL